MRATEVLSAWACERGRRLLLTSTDLVFDGTRSWYREVDPAVPILEYGRTKLAAEELVLASDRSLVVRLSLLFGPSRGARTSYFDQAIAALRSGTPQNFFEDEFRTPLDYVTAAQIVVRLAESDATGIIHAGGPERLSRLELMRRAATCAGRRCSGSCAAIAETTLPQPSPGRPTSHLIPPCCGPCCPISRSR